MDKQLELDECLNKIEDVRAKRGKDASWQVSTNKIGLETVEDLRSMGFTVERGDIVTTVFPPKAGGNNAPA